MTTAAETSKGQIEGAVRGFASRPLYEAGLGLLDALGYRSDRTMRAGGLAPFRVTFDPQGRLRDQAAHIREWKTIEFLRQITANELTRAAQNAILFRPFDQTDIQSYLFLAIDLQRESYPRTVLSSITRAVNRVFDMPAMVLFKHGAALTLAVINRRLGKRDPSRDVLEKVTLVKDISIANPLRAHVEILHDLSLQALYEEFRFGSFEGLHNAWADRLAGDALNRRFYKEIAAWYFWAVGSPDVTLPRTIASSDLAEREKLRSVFFIRLLTRVIFCWFLQEKGLIPREIFRASVARELLKDFSDQAGTYYRVFLQNLFFGTLNQEQRARGWRIKNPIGRDGNRGITTVWRYQDLVKDAGSLEVLLRYRVPFVNGGLFDCLDDVRKGSSKDDIRLDDFSEEIQNTLCIPNELFFAESRTVDLSAVFEDASQKRVQVRGLIEILRSYKFTVEENTPLEQEIALDPELLGKVFENLLAAHNPESSTAARRATGSYYTPREIVNYMVDEALTAALTSKVLAVFPKAEEVDARLRHLFARTNDRHLFTDSEVDGLIRGIDQLKILDPACGSGAFPMGVLDKLVFVLGKLDPSNARWKARQLEKTAEIPDAAGRDRATADIEEAFTENSSDYGRKLHLIENCIYGVDIQTIAVEISKLRFFISLIVDQESDPQTENLGIRPLPNLETKFVAANILVSAARPSQQSFRSAEINDKEEELRRVRGRHFLARTPATKAKYRERDTLLRADIAELLARDDWDHSTAKMLANWDPYDHNAVASFFDPEWMFGVDAGFDVVIGNPPYISAVTMARDEETKKRFKNWYPEATGAYDVYILFLLRGARLASANGTYCWIVPNRFLIADYAKKTKSTLLNKFGLCWAVDVSTFKVFQETGVYPIVIMGIAGQTKSFAEYVISSRQDLENRRLVSRANLRSYKTFGELGIRIMSGATGFQAQQLKSQVRTKQTRSAIPFVVSGSIDRYRWSNQNVRYMGDTYREAYVENGTTIPSSKWRMWNEPKIVVAGMTRVIEAVFCEQPLGLGVGVYAITAFGGVDPLCLCGILNSRFMTYYMREKFQHKHLAGGYLAINKSTIEALPLVEVPRNLQSDIRRKVENINSLKAARGDADTSAFEQDIDALVFRLFGVTPDELRNVERSFAEIGM